jgi:hypothetical protein
VNPYLAYIKIGAAALLLAIAAGAGYHFGGLASKTALEADHAAQLQAVVNRLDENAREATADHAHLQRVIDRYDATKDIPDPASVGTAHRVYLYAASACGGGLPEARALAGGVPGATPVTIGPSEVERRLDDYIRACGEDANLLRTVQALAPLNASKP